MKVKNLFHIMLMAILFIMCPISGCYRWIHVEVKDPREAMFPIDENEIPPLYDDLDEKSLKLAVENSLKYIDRLPKNKKFIYGPDTYTAMDVKRSMEFFLSLLERYGNTEILWKKVYSSFRFYRVTGRDIFGEVFFTGYYEPVIDGRLNPDPIYSFPIYRRPADLIEIDLGLFKKGLPGERIVGRLFNGKLVPYYTREEIVSKRVLASRGLEIAWLKDPVEIFFLQIQGSGKIRLPDGRIIRVNYAGTNGRPYRSLGRILIDKGLIAREEISMQTLKKFLRENPDMKMGLMNINESYTFFRVVDEGPMGNIEVPLTPGRSIATDASLFPRGALAFLRTKKPVLNDSGKIKEWIPMNRFALNQDGGGEIRGAGRVDIFWGEGEFAEMAAGHMKHSGELYFLIYANKFRDF